MRDTSLAFVAVLSLLGSGCCYPWLDVYEDRRKLWTEDVLVEATDSGLNSFAFLETSQPDRVFVRRPDGRVSLVRDLEWDELARFFKEVGSPAAGELQETNTPKVVYRDGKVVTASFRSGIFQGWGFSKARNGPFAVLPFSEYEFAQAFGAKYEAKVTKRPYTRPLFAP